METSIDGKRTVNTLYHAAVETVLAVGYSELGKKVLRKPIPKVDFNIEYITMLSIDILLAMATKNLLVKHEIIIFIIIFLFLY